MSEIGYKPSVLRMRLLISAGLTALGLALWWLAGWGFANFDAILGALVTLYFGARVVGNLVEILFPRPVIRISEDGVQDRRLGSRTIPWAAIREMKEVSAKLGSGTVFLEVRDPARFVGPSKGILWLVYAVRRLLQSDREQTGFLPLSPPIALELGETSLREQLQAHAPHDIPVT